MTSETKICRNCKSRFTIEPERLDFYRKVDAPLPVLCLSCMWQQQMAFWPFGKFHKRTCDLTGEKIISLYSQNTRFPVYKTHHWYSDKWTPPFLDLDISKSFFEQLYRLQSKVPRPHQFGANNTNSDYCDDAWESKNCYLSRSFTHCENISYSYRCVRCRDSYDLMYCYDTEQSYDCIYCFKVFNVKHAFDVRDSFDSALLYDCRNVRNCFMCWNLRNREYCILNRPYSKEDYYRKFKEYHLGSFKEVEKLKEEFRKQIQENAIHKSDFNVKTINSNGNYLTECKNLKNSYFFERSEDCINVFRGLDQKTSCDSVGLWNGELALQCANSEKPYNLKYSNYCVNCRDSEYLDFCVDCGDCFGCVGLRNKRFCILNKQYDEREYKELLNRIKEKMMHDGEYGQFFPYKMATTGYNLCLLASTHFPKTKEEVERLGGLWEEVEPIDTSISVIEPADEISNANDEIIGKGIKCIETSRPFNVTKDELTFLRKHDIPIPRKYPDVRTIERYKKLPVINIRHSQCYFCRKSITHFYPPEWGYKKIACVECYQKEVI